jgi:glycosyltransferase involved in cell wall biosynthesis
VRADRTLSNSMFRVVKNFCIINLSVDRRKRRRTNYIVKIALLIPSYNQLPWGLTTQQKIAQCCEKLRREGLRAVIVFVDDGSTQNSTELEYHIENLQSIGKCEVFATKHNVNRGQGAALMTALDIARSGIVGAELFVTLDSDGQHDPDDIFTLLKELRLKNLNIVFGNRFSNELETSKTIPFLRKFLLRTASLFERVLTGLKLTDAHNGFRLFDLKTALSLNLRQDRMAHATEIKQRVRDLKLKYGEAPVRIYYTTESTMRGQKNTNSFNILRELFQGWLFQ